VDQRTNTTLERSYDYVAKLDENVLGKGLFYHTPSGFGWFNLPSMP
jgi:hypothetical protein